MGRRNQKNVCITEEEETLYHNRLLPSMSFKLRPKKDHVYASQNQQTILKTIPTFSAFKIVLFSLFKLLL